MTLVDLAALNAMRAERDAALAENARLRAAVLAVAAELHAQGWNQGPRYAAQLRATLAAPTADDGAERGAR